MDRNNDEDWIAVLEAIKKANQRICAMITHTYTQGGILDTRDALQQIVDFMEEKEKTPLKGHSVPEINVGCQPGRCS